MSHPTPVLDLCANAAWIAITQYSEPAKSADCIPGTVAFPSGEHPIRPVIDCITRSWPATWDSDPVLPKPEIEQ